MWLFGGHWLLFMPNRIREQPVPGCDWAGTYGDGGTRVPGLGN